MNKVIETRIKELDSEIIELRECQSKRGFSILRDSIIKQKEEISKELSNLDSIINIHNPTFTRLEIINHSSYGEKGRQLHMDDVRQKMTFSLQDDGDTCKIFISDKIL